MKLREYQQELLYDILKAIPEHEKICVQLSTGGGKTVTQYRWRKNCNFY